MAVASGGGAPRISYRSLMGGKEYAPKDVRPTTSTTNQASGEPSVRTLQRKLREAGYDIAVDGIMGPQTAAAQADFERRQSSVSGGGGGGTSGSSGGGGGGGTAAPAPSPAPSPSPPSGGGGNSLQEMIRSIQEQPLDPEILAAFAERRRAATRQFQEAQIQGQRYENQAQRDFETFINRLGEQRDDAVHGLRQEAAARNLAFQPAFVGVGQRDIRDESAQAQAQAQTERASYLSAIQQQIENARQARNAEIAAITRDTARAKAQHDRFINSQVSALRGVQ